MKWAIILVIVVAIVSAIVLPKKSVRAELEIQTDPATVWATITNPSSYGDWHELFIDVSGEYKEGNTMEVSMVTQDGSATPVQAQVIKVLPTRHLNQSGGWTGILTFNHNWYLEPTATGTLVTQYEEYRGVGVLFYNPASVQVAYQKSLENLAQYLTE